MNAKDTRVRLSVDEMRVICSLKGFDAYAMDKGMDFQPPSQNLILLDSRYGFCMYQQVFPF